MKIKFIRDAVVMVDGVPNVMFKQEDIQDLNPASAERWLRRGFATDVVEETKPEDPKGKGKKG